MERLRQLLLKIRIARAMLGVEHGRRFSLWFALCNLVDLGFSERVAHFKKVCGG